MRGLSRFDSYVLVFLQAHLDHNNYGVPPLNLDPKDRTKIIIAAQNMMSDVDAAVEAGDDAEQEAGDPPVE